jgi:hypothetical protein
VAAIEPRYFAAFVRLPRRAWEVVASTPVEYDQFNRAEIVK